MNAKCKMTLAVLTGVAIGAAAGQGLHAQAKPKAYTISELETLDAAAQKTYAPHAEAAIEAAGGHTFYTAGGKVVAVIGDAPKRVAIIEWDSLEQAQAFYKSKAWTDLAAERDKAQKTVRMYAVEARTR